jgi:predicted thioesterase
MGKIFTQTKTIGEQETAIALGSGTLPVWATPAMIAFMENTAIQSMHLPEGKTSVGVKMDAQHLKLSAVGDKVTCKAIISSQNDKKIVFTFEVINESGEVIGLATHERYIVDTEQFMGSLQVKK